MVFEDDVAIINKSGSSRDASLLGREDPRADFHQRANQIEIQQSPLAYAFMEPRYVTEMRRPPLLYIARLLAIDELLCVVNDHQMFLQKDGGLRKDFVRTRIHFDLLRLNIANRILELHSQEKATSASELVPEFFEEELVHPDTGVAYEWDAEAGEFVYEEAE
ncbi:MAG: hypothetical protein KC917_21250 [Candidatus Omnitrophica bacterium]|nr:hypothetical protein [Candidatus Omnitrophota bacterium]